MKTYRLTTACVDGINYVVVEGVNDGVLHSITINGRPGRQSGLDAQHIHYENFLMCRNHGIGGSITYEILFHRDDIVTAPVYFEAANKE